MSCQRAWVNGTGFLAVGGFPLGRISQLIEEDKTPQDGRRVGLCSRGGGSRLFSNELLKT